MPEQIAYVFAAVRMLVVICCCSCWDVHTDGNKQSAWSPGALVIAPIYLLNVILGRSSLIALPNSLIATHLCYLYEQQLW